MNTTNPTLRTAVEDLWAHMTNNPARPRGSIDFAEPADTPMRHLTPVEVATMRVDIDLSTPVDMATHNIAVEAGLRLRAWEAHQSQAWKSGRQIARELQCYFWPQSHKARHPLRGLELLRHIDATSADHGVTVWVDTLGPDDRYRKMRLHERLAVLTYSERHQHDPE